jgi:hypothetical protein
LVFDFVGIRGAKYICELYKQGSNKRKSIVLTFGNTSENN